MTEDTRTEILETEIWKRAEENKFRNYLSAKEQDMLEKASYEWEMKENKREEQFQIISKQIQALES
jgi:hypothetical protein